MDSDAILNIKTNEYLLIIAYHLSILLSDCSEGRLSKGLIYDLRIDYVSNPWPLNPRNRTVCHVTWYNLTGVCNDLQML